MGRFFQSLLKAFCLLILVLLVAEAGLTLWARGAYHHPNFYQDDHVLGVTLIPNSTMRLAYHGVYPATVVNTNSAGFRGADFPEPRPNDIAVFGDSLSFGLGVEDDETYSHQLETMLDDGTQVFNYSVPAYGLYEQTLLVQQIIKKHTPRHLIYAISSGRSLGKPPEPYSGKFTAEHGWLGGTEEGQMLFPVFLPNFVLRWSHLVNTLRHRGRDMTQQEMAAKVIDLRWEILMESAERATAERQRLKEAQWFELQGPDGSPRSWSHLLPYFRDLKEVLKGTDTELILLLLPQDVSIDPDSWTKYGLEPQDTAPIQILIENFIATTKALGISAIDAGPSLEAAEGTVTLPRDWHFTPMGHRTIAKDLLQHLQTRSIEQ